MTIWFALWFLLSATLLYFLFWTLFILYRQKMAWKAYGQRTGLRYDSESLFASPTLSGSYEDYTISLFTGEHLAADMRGSRKLAAIEIHLRDAVFPVMGGVASGDMVGILKSLTVQDEYKPEHEAWQEDTCAAVCENRNVMQTYLTSARLEALTKLMKIKNAWIILIFKGDTALLRLDTPQPLTSEKVLEMLVTKMVETAKVLEFEPGEAERLKTEGAKKPERQAEIQIAADEIDTGSIQLEDEESEEDENPSTENI